MKRYFVLDLWDCTKAQDVNDASIRDSISLENSKH